LLQKLGSYIAEALERAQAAEARARKAANAEVRVDNEAMARHWRVLARSFEFCESLEQFLIDSQRNRDLLPPKLPSLDETPFAQGPDAVGARPCPRCGKVMEFRHMLGSFGERPPLQVFRCEACGATDFVPA
jgi:hypothetical protein